MPLWVLQSEVVAWSISHRMQPWKRLRSRIHENTQPQSARNRSCQHSREAEERRKARGGRKQWRPTLGLACLLSHAMGHRVRSGFTQTSSPLHCSLSQIFLLNLFTPHLALRFDPSRPLLCVQCLAKQQQQKEFVVQPIARSFFPKMAAVKRISAS